MNRGERVLVVDDDDDVRAALVDMLEHLGWEATEAGNWAQALALVRDEPAITVLLTDLRMPGMTGPDLARRATSIRPGLRVVFVTGLGGIELRDRLPGALILHKPVTLADLETALSEPQNPVGSAPPAP